MKQLLNNGGNVKPGNNGVRPWLAPHQNLAECETGVPESLRLAMEYLSGLDLSDVRVHYNSASPARFLALAYAYGNHIHLGPGQEHLLAHELWHVVQQKQGHVRPTAYASGREINDDPRLEQEATLMGAAALRLLACYDVSRVNAQPRLVRPRSSFARRVAFSPVFQFTLEDAIKYARETLGATDDEIGKTDREKREWIAGYVRDTKNDRDARILLKIEYERPEVLPTPDDLIPFFPQATPRPVIVNNAENTWASVSEKARGFVDAPIEAGTGGVVPDVDLQTRIRGIESPIVTQLNPSDSYTVDVKSTAKPNQPHTHQNMASWSKLSDSDDETRQNAATNLMRVVKRSAIDDGKPGKGLIRVAVNDEENRQALNVAVAFATELTVAEAHYGGPEALANAMANLYVIKHGFKRPWKSSYYGTGTGGAGKLSRLSSGAESQRNAALLQAYKQIAVSLGEIYDQRENKLQMSFEQWVQAKFRRWTEAFDPTFVAEHEVSAIVSLKEEADERKRMLEARIRNVRRPDRIGGASRKLARQDDDDEPRRDEEEPETKKKRSIESSEDQDDVSESPRAIDKRRRKGKQKRKSK
jgi:hypothetical protein